MSQVNFNKVVKVGAAIALLQPHEGIGLKYFFHPSAAAAFTNVIFMATEHFWEPAFDFYFRRLFDCFLEGDAHINDFQRVFNKGGRLCAPVVFGDSADIHLDLLGNHGNRRFTNRVDGLRPKWCRRQVIARHKAMIEELAKPCVATPKRGEIELLKLPPGHNSM